MVQSSRGVTHLSLLTDINAEQYSIGCWKDTGHRAVEAIWVDSSKMTNNMCYAICETSVSIYKKLNKDKFIFIDSSEKYIKSS